MISLETIRDILSSWLEEMQKYSSELKIDSEVPDFGRLLSRIDYLSGVFDRVEGIRSQFFILYSKVEVALHDAKDTLSKVTDEIRKRDCSKMVASGYGADERFAFCRSDPKLLDLRIYVKNLEESKIVLENFRIIIEGKLNALQRSRFDCGVVKDLLIHISSKG